MFENFSEGQLIKRGIFTMKKHKLKRFASLFLATTVVAGALAGCSSDGGGASSEGNKVDGDTIKIGANLELSGNVASYGSSIGDGAQLAVDEINAAGGINGKKLDLVTVDNKSENQEAATAALRLVEKEKVVAMISPATSGNTLATVQTANDNKVPSISAAATATNITVADNGSVNEYAFRTCFLDDYQAFGGAEFAIDSLGAKNVAILSDNSSDYGKGLAAAFKSKVEESGGKVVAEELYIAKDTDFRTTLTNIKGKNPDLIYIPGYYDEVALIIKQARELGITAPLLGGDGWDSPKMLEVAGSDALNQTYFTNHYSVDDESEKVKSFVTAFNDKYSKSPDAFHALGYDSVYYLKDAIERVEGDITGEAIKDALEQTKDLELVTGTFSVDEEHNPVKSIAILEFADGKQVLNSKVNP